MTRAISLVGCTRSLISALTESIDPDHEPVSPLDRRSLLDFPFFADDAADAIQLVGHPFEMIHHFVEDIADLAAQADPIGRQTVEKSPFRSAVRALIRVLRSSSSGPTDADGIAIDSGAMDMRDFPYGN